MVARNSVGKLIEGINQKLTCEVTKVMEEKATLLGIRLAIKKGWDQVEIKSESEVVINQLPGKLHLWRIETTFSNITRLAGNIELIELKEVQRTKNKSANWIAKQSRLRVCLNDWISQPLPLLVLFN